jgi:Na+-translocating ferredoxin:NAD+ oxidoreductase RnfG subunit
MKWWQVIVAAIVLLIAGQVYGRATQGIAPDDILDLYKQLLPEAADFKPLSPSTAEALDQSGAALAYVGIASHNGYGGPMLVGAIVEPTGKLREPVILRHNETPSFLSRVTGGRYFTQYKDKPTDSVFVLGVDIDAVSGATLSSRAVADGVRESANGIARTVFALNPQQPAAPWRFGSGEIAAILLFTAGYVMYRVKQLQKYRLALLGVSIVVLGFWLNRAYSPSGQNEDVLFRLGFVGDAVGGVLALSATALFVSLAAVIRLTRPIEYKR